ncbi:MAG: enoyl-CoA hydratase-related protein [Marmoricola sp.]
MPATDIALDIADGTATITLSGPHTRNALDAAAAADLIAACDRIDADDSIGVAVVTGAGGTFCSGADTSVLNALRTAAPREIYDGLDSLYAAFRRVGVLAVPTVALVTGPAVGAGVNLALAADLRLVTSSAAFVSGFARIGLHPGGGHLHLLARAAGTTVASAAGVFGQKITAEQAVTHGLAIAVDPDDLAGAIGDHTAHLAADPALARALIATLRRTVLDASVWDRAVEVERARQMWSLTRTAPVAAAGRPKSHRDLSRPEEA